MKLDDKLNLYFFDPYKDEDDYCNEYRKIRKQPDHFPVAYTPLYLIRRQTLLLSGEIIRFEKPVNHTPYFPAMILSEITLDMLAELLGFKKSTMDLLFKEYFGNESVDRLGIRLLRNALEHNNFQLFTRVKKNDRYSGKAFEQLFSYLKSKGHLKGLKQNISMIKVTFTLKTGIKELVLTPTHAERRPDHLVVNYQVDPAHYLRTLHKKVSEIEQKIRNSGQLREKFDTTITADNWMIVYPIY